MYHNKGLEWDTILANSHHHPNSSNLVSFHLSSNSNSNTQEDTQAITIPSTEEDHLHHHQLLDQVQDK